MKFTTKGWVSLKVTKVSEIPTHITLNFSVTDTGIGIRDVDLKKLFSPFAQVDGYVQRQQHGSGLGLVITKQLLMLMDSKLVVESVFGKGSKFHFTITFPKVSPMKPFYADHVILSHDPKVVDKHPHFYNGSQSAKISVSSVYWMSGADNFRRAKSVDQLFKTSLIKKSSMDKSSRPARYFYKLFVFIDGCPENRRLFQQFEDDLFILTLTFPSIMSFLDYLELSPDMMKRMAVKRKAELLGLNMDEEQIARYVFPKVTLEPDEIGKAQLLSKFIFDRHAEASFQGIAVLSIDDASLREYYANVPKIHLNLLFPTFITTLNKAIVHSSPYLQNNGYFCGLFRRERRNKLGTIYSMFSEHSDAIENGKQVLDNHTCCIIVSQTTFCSSWITWEY